MFFSKNSKLFHFVTLFFIFLSFVFLAPPARAVQYVCCDESLAGGNFASFDDCQASCSDASFCEQGMKCPEQAAEKPAASAPSGVTGVALPNPLGTTSVREIIGNIIAMLIGGAGSIALLMFVYGGLLWLTSAGNAEKIKKGQAIILWSVLGMVVMFSAYIIVKYVLGAILGAAGTKF